ncbi:hypothetical protein PM082_009341 [Marasmius tenuissimus]|nr:hypothetical protein PM082_009341 [Marasmius tenuissimus]
MITRFLSIRIYTEPDIESVFVGKALWTHGVHTNRGTSKVFRFVSSRSGGGEILVQQAWGRTSHSLDTLPDIALAQVSGEVPRVPSSRPRVPEWRRVEGGSDISSTHPDVRSMMTPVPTIHNCHPVSLCNYIQGLVGSQ